MEIVNAERHNAVTHQARPMLFRPVYKYESFIDFVHAIQIRNREILWRV